MHEVYTFSKTTEVWTRENCGLGWYEFSCARRFLGACYDSCVMAVALPLALAIIPIFIALYALRVSPTSRKVQSRSGRFDARARDEERA